MLSKDLKLEKWKREDDQPPLPPFTGETKIKLHFPEDVKISFFANLFPTNELFEMTAHQKKPYAHQCRERHWYLPRHSRASKWVDVTI